MGKTKNYILIFIGLIIYPFMFLFFSIISIIFYLYVTIPPKIRLWTQYMKETLKLV